MSSHPLFTRAETKPFNIRSNRGASYHYINFTSLTLGDDDEDAINDFTYALTHAIQQVVSDGFDTRMTRYAVLLIGTNYTSQTRYVTSDEILELALNLVGKESERYEEENGKTITDIYIMKLELSSLGVLAQSGNFGVRFIGGDLIVSPGSRENCGFTVFALGIKTLHGVDDSAAMLLFDKVALNQFGSRFKLTETPFTDTDCCTDGMFLELANIFSVNLRIFNTDLKGLCMDVNTNKKDKVELCYFGGHVSLIIRRAKLLDAMVNYEPRISNRQIEMLPEEIRDQIRGFVPTPLIDALTQEYTSESMDVSLIEEFMCSTDQCQIIEPKYPSKKHDLKIASWDSETTNKRVNGDSMDQRPYSVGFAYYNLKEVDPEATDERTPNKVIYHWYKGFTCMTDMLEAIHKMPELQGYTFYAHNSSKFDLHVFFQHGLLELPSWNVSKIATRAGALLKIQLVSKTNKKFVITFLDSVRLIQGSLKALLAEARTMHQKLDFDHTVVNEENCLEQPNLEEYQKNDVVGLLELLHIFSHSIWKLMNINITQCLTSASMAKRNFFQNHYNKSTDPIYRLSRELDKYIRSGYNGGRVETTHMGHFKGKYYYYDVTSLYPSEATKKLPCEKPIVRTKAEVPDIQRYVFPKINKVSPGVFGFVRCLVTGPSIGKRPLHSIYSNNKLMFPVFEKPTEIVLFTEEIRLSLAKDLGYTYEVIDLVQFSPKNILKNVMESGFKQKAEEAFKENYTNAGAWKIVINSTYGFFGLVVDELDSIKIYPANDPVPIDDRINAMLVEDRFKSFLEIGNYHLLRGHYDINVPDFNVGIAAAITSYSRMTLYDIMDTFEQDGANVFYYDTDSVIVDKSIKECPNVMARYQEDGTGDALGSLKNECTAILKKKFKDTMDLETALDKEPYFDEMVLLGCKNYAVRRTSRIGGKDIVILKMKGIDMRKPLTSIVNPGSNGKEEDLTATQRFLKFEDYILISKGSTLKQTQEQFKAGYATLMNVETKGGSRIIEVSKKISSNYNKGLLEKIDEFTSVVRPLIMSDHEDIKTGRILHLEGRECPSNLLQVTFKKHDRPKKIPAVKRKKSGGESSKSKKNKQ